jgi:integrase/recombinase XerD
MSALSLALEDYLELRRSLGYKLERAGELLADFVGYSDAKGVGHVRTETALTWALLAPSTGSRWRADRLGAVRNFARYLHAIDPTHEIPPTGLIPRGRGRPAPYLFTDDEVSALMLAARRLRSALRAATLETIIGLLAVTGLRVGEVLRLDNRDLDANDAVLVIRRSKGGNSRMVPLQRATLERLVTYVALRDEQFPEPRSESLFVSSVGRRIGSGNLREAFVEVVALAGLSPRSRGRGPNLGGFRHTFAVETLISWHEDGLEIAPRMPLLSTYLGHVSPSSTYWYFSASPRLLEMAARRAASKGWER